MEIISILFFIGFFLFIVFGRKNNEQLTIPKEENKNQISSKSIEEKLAIAIHWVGTTYLMNMHLKLGYPKNLSDKLPINVQHIAYIRGMLDYLLYYWNIDRNKYLDSTFILTLKQIYEKKYIKIETLLSSSFFDTDEAMYYINLGAKDVCNLQKGEVFLKNIPHFEINDLHQSENLEKPLIDNEINKSKFNSRVVVSLMEEPQIMEVLINNDIDFNAEDEDGITYLMHACSFSDNPQVIESLIKNGANINYENKDGLTALMFALDSKANPNIIRLLNKN
ncbi:MAG: ankyrin repeat domain-containing protein [Alphaproteobacteria bacterium]|nr:ankyrin repeat domain-containing protein [Alphaproteobacteria bacterium]